MLAERFGATCVDLAAAAADRGTDVVAGADGWYFSAAELAAIGRGTPPAGVDPIVAIRSTSDRLARRGVTLLVVPVPPKSVIYPERAITTRAAAVFPISWRSSSVCRWRSPRAQRMARARRAGSSPRSTTTPAS